jgi:formyl-CoA transferase
MLHVPASTALDDLTVIDLTRVRAGPTCVRQLADWGASVIKIEMPGEAGDPTQTGPAGRHDPDFQNLHRNKRSMTLNLKAKEGREVLCKMLDRTDIIVENYRPDVKDRLGIDYGTLSAINPRMICTAHPNRASCRSTLSSIASRLSCASRLTHIRLHYEIAKNFKAS